MGVNRILGFLKRFRSAYPDYVNATLWLAQTLARPPAPDRERIVALYAEQIRRIRSRKIPEGDRLEEKVSISFGEFYSGYLEPDLAVETLRPLLSGARGKENAEFAVAQPLAAAHHGIRLRRVDCPRYSCADNQD